MIKNEYNDNIPQKIHSLRNGYNIVLMRDLVRDYSIDRLFYVVDNILTIEDLDFFHEKLKDFYKEDIKGNTFPAYFQNARFFLQEALRISKCAKNLEKVAENTIEEESEDLVAIKVLEQIRIRKKKKCLGDKKRIEEAARPFIDKLKSNSVMYKKVRDWIKVNTTSQQEKDFKDTPAYFYFKEGTKYIDYAIKEVCEFYVEKLLDLQVNEIEAISIVNGLKFGKGSIFAPSLNMKISLGLFYIITKKVLDSSEINNILETKLLSLLEEYFYDDVEDIVNLAGSNLTGSNNVPVEDCRIIITEKDKELLVDSIYAYFNAEKPEEQKEMAEIFIGRALHECAKPEKCPQVMVLVREFVQKGRIIERYTTWNELGDKLRMYGIYIVPNYNNLTDKEKNSIRNNWNKSVKL